jgi:hypothetical protein
MRTEQSWSYISNLPVVIRDSKTNIDICFWNGIALTRNYGRMLVGSIWCDIYYTQSVKDAAWNEFSKAYFANVFETNNKWNMTLENVDSSNYMNYIQRKICKGNTGFFPSLKEKYSAEEAISWFEYDRIIFEK